ncbi:MAG: response regulator [Eubacteriales bacterium]|nr:response regulator [Eubacteriales bacterium]
MREGEKHILVVDDNRLNLTIVKQALQEYQVTPLISGIQALRFLEKKIPDLILLDVNMPEMDGWETLRRIRSQERLKDIPVIFLTADSSSETEAKCLRLGAEDYIAKPFVPEVMKQRISRILELWDLRNDLENQLILRTRQMENVTVQSITAIAYAIDAKDPYTHGHSVRVANCSVEIAKRLNWSKEEQQNLYFSALLHDIGKIGIPDSILNKASSLTEEEMDVMRMHPAIGGEILKDIHSIRHMEEGARYHHEKYNGTGYPLGLREEQIPLIARIIGVADAYDAMSSNRAYRRHLTRERVREEIQKGRGTQFDPLLTDLFLEMMDQGFDLTGQEQGQISREEESGKLTQMLLHNAASRERKELSRVFSPDALTGLPGRSYAKERIQQHLGEEGSPCTLFIIGLKNLNDISQQYGHIYKDTVLWEVAGLLKKEGTGEDFAARISGDEFLFFMGRKRTDESVSWADAFLEKSRAHLEKSQVGRRCTMSIGIASAPECGSTFKEVCGNADKALYFARLCGDWTSHLFQTGGGKACPADLRADEDILKDLLEGRRSQLPEGAFQADSQEFQDICRSLQRGMEHKRQVVQLGLLTLTDGQRFQEADPVVMEEAMERLAGAIRVSIRSMDFFVRCSSCQMIVALVDTNREDGGAVMERIVSRFKENYPTRRIRITCRVQEMLHEKEGDPAGTEAPV